MKNALNKPYFLDPLGKYGIYIPEPAVPLGPVQVRVDGRERVLLWNEEILDKVKNV